MALNIKSKLLFLTRLAGLTGFMALIVGLVLWLGIGLEDEGTLAIFVGGGLLVLAILVELKGLLSGVFSRRGAMGSNVALQIALALAILIGVNVLSFEHYQRFDWTWNRLFTIDAAYQQKLTQLRGETKIVVYLRDTGSLGHGVDNKLAHFQAAAQRQIIEKVKDLADEFRELGPRFKVQVLNIQDEDFEANLAKIKQESAALAEAVEKAPENSIFFYSKGAVPSQDQVQRLSFQDIYQLDSLASLKSNDNQGNLVLNYQSERPFANKILKIEEKKPRVAVAVVHPALSMANRDNPLLTMSGAKKTLESHGFICQDLLLRKLDPEGRLSEEPAALTYDENRYEQIEDTLILMEEDIRDTQTDLTEGQKALDSWKNQSLAELHKTWVYIFLPNGREGVFPKAALPDLEKKLGNNKKDVKIIPIDEDDKKNKVMLYSRQIEILENDLELMRKERDELEKEKTGLRKDDLAEKRRIADVEVKMNRMLADTDLLIIPSFTFYNLPSEQIISNRVHKLDEAQLKSIKAFLKEGKPVLFLLGPRNEKRESPPGFGNDGEDGLEPMLAELGVFLPKQTVLYNAEIKEFTDRKISSDLTGRRELELPPLLVNWEKGAGQVAKKAKEEDKETLLPNPIRASMRLAQKSMGKKELEDLQARHARPVYHLKDPGNKAVFDPDAVFLMTSEYTWNENFPFIKDEPDEKTGKREVPKIRPTPDSDPKKGTLEEVRHGPFPIAAAFEQTLPKSWYDDQGTPAKARLAVLGQGGIFVGQNLAPIKEKLLLDTCNWLLGRDDLLAKDNEVWQYPRVNLSETEKNLWHWGAFLGMPLLFAYFGAMVLMVRRMR